MARGRPRETAALRLLTGWVYPLDPHYYHTQIPLSPSLFIDGHSSRMKIEETGEGKRKRKREKERLLLSSLLSALSLRRPSFRFSLMRKMQIAIALLRNDTTMTDKCRKISPICQFVQPLSSLSEGI